MLDGYSHIACLAPWDSFAFEQISVGKVRVARVYPGEHRFLPSVFCTEREKFLQVRTDLEKFVVRLSVPFLLPEGLRVTFASGF